MSSMERQFSPAAVVVIWGIANLLLAAVLAGFTIAKSAGLLVIDIYCASAASVFGLAVLVPFVRYEETREEPLVDIGLLRAPGQWPVQLTAFLFGMSVLGAQIPLHQSQREIDACCHSG